MTFQSWGVKPFWYDLSMHQAKDPIYNCSEMAVLMAVLQCAQSISMMGKVSGNVCNSGLESHHLAVLPVLWSLLHRLTSVITQGLQQAWLMAQLMFFWLHSSTKNKPFLRCCLGSSWGTLLTDKPSRVTAPKWSGNKQFSKNHKTPLELSSVFHKCLKNNFSSL